MSKQEEIIGKLKELKEHLNSNKWTYNRFCNTCKKLVSEISALEKEIEQKPVYDENYLNECIEKAKPNLSKIKDVDKALDEIRGVEPLKTAEEILEKVMKNNKQFDFPKYVFEEDYAGGSRKYIREDLVLTSISEFASQKQTVLPDDEERDKQADLFNFSDEVSRNMWIQGVNWCREFSKQKQK